MVRAGLGVEYHGGGEGGRGLGFRVGGEGGRGGRGVLEVAERKAMPLHLPMYIYVYTPVNLFRD